jgi:transcriptional regulator with XRE-family HTH domain
MLRIRAARLFKNLEQKAIAAALGINRSYYCEIENGIRNPSADQRDRIARFFGIAPERLFDHVEGPPSGDPVYRSPANAE